MKNLLFGGFIVSLILAGFMPKSFSQYSSYYSSRNKAGKFAARIIKTPIEDEVIPGTRQPDEYVSNLRSALTDPTIMYSYYDLQTNFSSGMQRIYQFPDGSIGGVATMSVTTTGTSWPDRGTGYNYSADYGITWGTAPATRVENVRTGWPSIQPFGANGECIIAHQSSGPLVFSKRTTKGSGSWDITQPVPNPTGVPAMDWPRMVTNGTDHMNIHIIALTEPTANGGTVYNGMDGALLYARSTNGGATFSAWQQLPGITSADYIAISTDTYAWAMPHGDTLAFVSGQTWTDEFMMKSTDNGSTWTKTVIYLNPYDLIGYPGTAGNNGFYNPDGTSAIALDYYGNAHVCFGLQWDSTASDGSGTASYLPNMNGLVYWNETMPQLPQSLDPDTLYNHGNLIAWQLDTTIFWQGGSNPLPFASPRR